jgi:hypothetical protein
MDAHEARAALAESKHRQQQTVEASAATWTWRALSLAAAFVAFGLLSDVDMIWLGAIPAVVVSAVWARQAVQLRGRSSRRSDAVLTATFVFALLVDIAVQFAVRGEDLAMPNTWGAAAAALMIVLVARPIHARTAASRRP